jgi:hypothetical protein
VPFAPTVVPRKTSNATAPLNLPASAQFGLSAAAIGDLDNDGIQDLAVGDSVGMGSVWILFLRADRTVRAYTRLGAPSSVWNPTYGEAICGLGDLNGDGAEDIAVSSPWDCQVFVHFLRTDGTVLGSVRITDVIDPPYLPGALATYGEGLANLGDVDGDGVIDLLMTCGVGGDGDDPGFYVVFLNTNGTVKGFQRTPLGFSGLPCAALADLDHDGIREFALGNGAASGVRTYFLNPNGTVRTFKTLPWGSGPMVGVNDFDGNGVPDLALGSPFSIGGIGLYTLVGLDAQGDALPGSVQVIGPEGRSELLQAGDHFGSALAFLGNLDGRGLPEIAVGATGVDDGTANSGAIWIGAIH